MMKRNLNAETALKILMVSSEYELGKLKKETLELIKREVRQVLHIPRDLEFSKMVLCL